ncbi:MAG: hypothetical protein GOVbin1629_6 [Prokaryotic dsDNA virus sp.]|nr:MAG: hypothetical protein GOVbin1629_6 [Prokaryotic dsDNA virus sp.]|tara:strand:- start:19808 stop:20380 length:573 start_codon:yes stop_codon:yes gene_type:complete
MPNHVYTRIVISDPTKKQKEILKKIEKVGGLCRHYKPMPKQLEGTKANGKQYSWYEWCNENWDTKWGCYELEIEDNLISFTSAWSPIGDNIISMFAKDFPDFTYSWEEEQGYGSEMDYEGGKCVMQWDYDCPEWGDILEYKDCYLTELYEDHPNYESGTGYYLDHGQEYCGKTLEEAKEYIDETIKSSVI